MLVYSFKVFKAFTITTTSIYWKYTNSFCIPKVNASQWDSNWDDRKSNYQAPSGCTRKLLFIDNSQLKNDKKVISNTALRLEELVKKRNYKIIQLTSSVKNSSCATAEADIQLLVDDINDLNIDLPDKIMWSSFYNKSIESASFQPNTSQNHGNCVSDFKQTSQSEVFKNNSHLEVIFRDIFYRRMKPLNNQRLSQDRNENKNIELYCGDAKINKWLICRALQLPLEVYERFDSGGFTEFTIYEDGTILCDSINENSHLDIGNDKIQLKEKKKRKGTKSSTSSKEGLSRNDVNDDVSMVLRHDISDDSNVLCFDDDSQVFEDSQRSKLSYKKSRQSWKQHNLKVIKEEDENKFC